MARPALLAALAPAFVLALFLFDLARGEPSAVRGGRSSWLPQALAFLGVLGPSLLARGGIRREAARGFVLAGLAGILLHATLVALVPISAGEVDAARFWPVLDAVASGALVALAALAIRPAWAMAIWLMAAAVFARAGSRVLAEASPMVVTGSAMWVAAALLASTLAAVRIRARPRAVRD